MDRTTRNTLQSDKRIPEDTILAVPSTEYPFHIHVDSSNVGTGCILVQQFPEGKRIVSFNSRVFDKAEQKNVYPPPRTLRYCICTTDL